MYIFFDKKIHPQFTNVCFTLISGGGVITFSSLLGQMSSYYSTYLSISSSSDHHNPHHLHQMTRGNIDTNFQHCVFSTVTIGPHRNKLRQFEFMLHLECIFSLTKRSIHSLQMYASHLYQEGASSPFHHCWVKCQMLFITQAPQQSNPSPQEALSD